MIKKIVLPLALILSLCVANQVVSAAGVGGSLGSTSATGGRGAAPVRPASVPAMLVGSLGSWTLSDGSTQFGYTFQTSNGSYALAIAPDGQVTALPTLQVKTAPLPPAGSVKFNGQAAPSTVTIYWGSGTVDGATKSGYQMVLGGASYLWGGSTSVLPLTGTEALSFVSAP